MSSIITKLVCLFLLFQDIFSLWKDNFTSGFNSNWITDLDGSTGKISILKDSSGKFEAIRTNVTYCSSTISPCYRAELKNPNSLRPILIPSNSGEYWIGISIRIPSNWKWKSNTNQKITSYIFQIHGGDNNGQSPIIGIRNEGSVYTVNVCGNTAFSSPDAFCKYFTAGPVTSGVWEDWVIHDKFSFDNTSSATRGFVQVWRNGKKYVDATNLLTSYNDVTPHYIKFGSYIIQWKDPPVSTAAVNWVGSDYRSISVGGSTSSYAEVRRRLKRLR
mmetsp:Transcript_14615/g.15306  ORF Transcript_14615/g.15306 Transcript_14615/m.15306 type:complete len:274 (-) Transcript_14615:197-1018(-)